MRADLPYTGAMNTKSALIALVLTLVLAAVAFVVLRSGSTPTETGRIAIGQPTFIFEAASVRAISLRIGTETQVLDKHLDGTWLWRAEARSDRQYSLDPARVRAFLRMLNESVCLAQPAEDSSFPNTLSPVVLTLHGPAKGTTAADHIYRISPRALGGQVLVEVLDPGAIEPKYAYVRQDILNVLTTPGPIAWRETKLWPHSVGSASRITLRDASGLKGFSLTKRNEQWHVVEPVPERGNTEAIGKLLASLDGITILAWADNEPLRKAAGLDKPNATLTIESDFRGFDSTTNQPTTNTESMKLLVGNASDATGKNLYVTPDGGTTIVAVDAAVLSALAGAAGEDSVLYARNATSVLPADVHAIEISGNGSVRLERTATGWTEKIGRMPAMTQDAANIRATNEILAMLSTVACDRATVAPLTKKDDPRWTVRLLASEDAVLDSLTIWRHEQQVIVSNSKVYRVYSKPATALVRWLETVARDSK